MSRLNKLENEKLRKELELAVALQLYKEYEDEEDFETKFGKTDTLESAVGLFLKYKCKEDVVAKATKWIRLCPGSSKEILELFDLAEEDLDENAA